MEAVFNCQCSESHEINSDVSQDSLLVPTDFLLHTNDLPTNIFWSLVNISARDTTVGRCTYKSLDVQSIATYLSACLVLTAQCWKEGSVSFNTSQTKLATFSHHRDDYKYTPALMKVCTPNDVFCFVCPLGRKLR